MSLLSRIGRKAKRWTIMKVYPFNVDLYMRLYVEHLRKCGITVEGKPKYIAPTAVFDANDYSQISLGDNITMSGESRIFTHDYSITTASAALGNRIDRHEGELYLSQPVSIGRNCFIGARSMLLPGTHKGDNVIVGASAVVKGNIPDDSIVVGNPARVIANTREWAQRTLDSEYLRVEKG